MDQRRHLCNTALVQVLAAREHHSRTAALRVQIACVVFVAAALFVLLVTLFLLQRVRRLQNLATVCARTQRVKHQGQWVGLAANKTGAWPATFRQRCCPPPLSA